MNYNPMVEQLYWLSKSVSTWPENQTNMKRSIRQFKVDIVDCVETRRYALYWQLKYLTRNIVYRLTGY